MKIQIDLKSALVGLALGAGIMFTLGAGASNVSVLLTPARQDEGRDGRVGT